MQAQGLTPYRLESHLELNKYFSTVERWTEEEIQARAEALAKGALQIWPRYIEEF